MGLPIVAARAPAAAHSTRQSAAATKRGRLTAMTAGFVSTCANGGMELLAGLAPQRQGQLAAQLPAGQLRWRRRAASGGEGSSGLALPLRWLRAITWALLAPRTRAASWKLSCDLATAWPREQLSNRAGSLGVGEADERRTAAREARGL